ncbi:hypothetical protein HG531_003798 [Fusarium graminearum]|nr:hypothetical protein HG531_003798 [Fusarium graminearum]
MSFSGEGIAGDELNFWGVCEKSTSVPSSVSSSLHLTPPFFFSIFTGVKLMLFLEAPITLRRRGDPLVGLRGVFSGIKTGAETGLMCIAIDFLRLGEPVDRLLGVGDGFLFTHLESIVKGCEDVELGGKEHLDHGSITGLVLLKYLPVRLTIKVGLEQLGLASQLVGLSSIGAVGHMQLLEGGIPLLALLSELGKEHALGVLLLRLELVDQGHLLVNLDQKVLDVAVDVKDVARHLGLDILGPVCVSKGVLRLIEMRARWRDTDNHDGNVLLLSTVAKCVDTASKGEKGLVDVGSLYKALAAVLCDRRSFGASKIDDAEGGHGVRLIGTG